MAKLNLTVFKRGKPIYWVIGGIVVFVVFYMLFTKSAPSSGGAATAYSTGPSEAFQAAQMQYASQIQMAGIAAQSKAAEIQAANNAAVLSANVAMANLAMQEKVGLFQLARESDLATLQLENNRLINQDNITYGLESARIAGETQLGLRALDIGLLTRQMETQAEMFATQSQNLVTQTLISATSNLKKKDRDDALAGIGGYTPVYGGSSGGGSALEAAAGLVPNLLKIF